MKFVIEIDAYLVSKHARMAVGHNGEIARCLRYLADEIDKKGLAEQLPVTDTYNRLVGHAGWRNA